PAGVEVGATGRSRRGHLVDHTRPGVANRAFDGVGRWNDVRGQDLTWRVGPFPHGHRDIRHIGVRAQPGPDTGEVHPVAADLDLSVHPAGQHELSVGSYVAEI